MRAADHRTCSREPALVRKENGMTTRIARPSPTDNLAGSLIDAVTISPCGWQLLRPTP